MTGERGRCRALLVELLFTFAIVYVVLSVGVSPFQEPNVFYGVAVGVVVLARVADGRRRLGGRRSTRRSRSG